MKKLFAFLFLTVFLISCSKDDKADNPVSYLSQTPIAKAAYDNNNYGIYKGVFVGSSGTVLINLNNNNSINAVVKINNITTTYTTTETISQGEQTSVTFTNGSNSFVFNVNADGQNPNVSDISISGHPNASISLLKEMSDSLVECFEGTFSGDDNGVFNIAVIHLSSSQSQIAGLAHSTPNDETFDVWGAVNNTSITGEFAGGSYTGTRTGNTMMGSWTNSLSESGIWSGTRTL